ncbi:MAG: class I SAM-dependent methyltransferase [Methanosarcinales archaeon]|nr:class I SAM-dependent methyltransferase [Methanosarcinales archaeon]
MTSAYVHGYSDRESERLQDQASTLADLLHHDTCYPPESLVLEAGCGIGAQTAILARSSPGARLVSMDISRQSLLSARRSLRSIKSRADHFLQADIFHLPFSPESYDHVFLCFVLEHLPDPGAALKSLMGLLKPGGTMTCIEGDHGSCFFHPRSREALGAWDCLVQVQAGMKGDSLIGRRLYPLMAAAGLKDVAVSPRMVYSDASRPHFMEGFVRRTIIPMVEGVEGQALEAGMMDRASWEQGIRDLHLTARPPEGTFCYTFFKGVGIKE